MSRAVLPKLPPRASALLQSRRGASIASSGALAASSALNVFDTESKLRQKNRAAKNVEFSRITDYLKDEVAGIMVDRLLVRLSALGDVKMMPLGTEIWWNLCRTSNDGILP